MKLKFITPLLLSALMLGCGSAPSSVIIAPQIYTPTQSVYSGQAAQLKVNDLRRQHHVIQILKKDDAAKLYSPANDISSSLRNSLSAQWVKQGIQLNNSATTQITVMIDAALVSVQQETVKYQANSEIRLRVQIQKGDKTLTNNFKSKGSSNGPLFADVAVLERDFNQQLGKVITEVLKNPEIQAFIQN